MPSKFKRAKWVKISDAEYRKEVLGLTLIVDGKWKVVAKYQKKTLLRPAWTFRIMDSAGKVIIAGGDPVTNVTCAKTLAGKAAKDYAMQFARLDDYRDAIGLPPPAFPR